jgi:hypothetical protein
MEERRQKWVAKEIANRVAEMGRLRDGAVLFAKMVEAGRCTLPDGRSRKMDARLRERCVDVVRKAVRSEGAVRRELARFGATDLPAPSEEFARISVAKLAEQ